MGQGPHIGWGFWAVLFLAAVTVYGVAAPWHADPFRPFADHVPATHAPATHAPATHAPATHAPATHAPVGLGATLLKGE